MQSIPTLKLHDNGFYYVHWTAGRRSRRVSTGTKNVAGAKAFLAEWLTLEREEEKAVEAATLLTFEECWQLYIKAKPPSDESAIPKWAKNLRQHFRHLTPDKITDDEVKAYLELRTTGKIGRKSVSGSVRSEVAIMCACLNWCSNNKGAALDKG